MNFFKNAIIYRLTNPMALMAQLPTLEDSLCAFQFNPCGSQDMARTGWVPATEQHHTLVHQALLKSVLLFHWMLMTWLYITRVWNGTFTSVKMVVLL